MNDIESDELYPGELPQDAGPNLTPDAEEIMASGGVYGTGMAWEKTGGKSCPQLPGRTYASTTNCEFQDMLKEVRDNIDSYKLAKDPATYLPEGAYQAPYAKASPGDLAAIEHAIAILEKQGEKLIRAFKLGAASAREATAVRYCPDCKPEDGKPLPPRQRYCDKHRDQRRKATHQTFNRKRKLTTVTTLKPKDCIMRGRNTKKTPNPVNFTPTDMVKRAIVRAMEEEKLGLYAAAEKLGIVELQVIRWILKDEEFRLMVRAIEVVRTVKFLEEVVALKHSGRPLNVGEQVVVDYYTKLAAMPGAWDIMVGLVDVKDIFAKMSAEEMQAFNADLTELRTLVKSLPRVETPRSVASFRLRA
jgi:hypothetical protein